MNPRLAFALAVLVACAAAAVLGVSLAARGDGGGARAAASAGTGWAGALRPPGLPPQDFDLRDQDGKPASLAAYRGQVVILAFMYSTCEDTCPLQAQTIKGALDDLGHELPVLAVSVDPADDTPARARRFLVKQGMTGRMRFLLGTRAQLAPVWKAYAIQPQGADFEHSAYVLLIDRQGRQRVGHPAEEMTSDGLVHDLRRLEGEGARAQAVAAKPASDASAASARSSAAR
ncbi:MAG TPA: SCO family protein [Solirubrobacteraceae bacterium]|jgi:protein SCO1/2